LRLNSRYGEITFDGIREFLDGADIDLSGISLPELPDLSERLDELLESMPNVDAVEIPEFLLYCPECGERYEATDDELRGAIVGEG